MDKKICPLFVVGFLSHTGITQEQDEHDVECFERCSFWDKHAEQCVFLTISDALVALAYKETKVGASK